MALGVALTVVFAALIGGLILLGLRQRLTLEVPPRPWPKAVAAPPVFRRLRVIRWSLLPALMALAVLEQSFGWIKWALLLPIAVAYLGTVAATVVIGVRLGLKANRERKRSN
jgi:hypothetical protein